MACLFFWLLYQYPVVMQRPFKGATVSDVSNKNLTRVFSLALYEIIFVTWISQHHPHGDSDPEKLLGTSQCSPCWTCFFGSEVLSTRTQVHCFGSGS